MTIIHCACYYCHALVLVFCLSLFIWSGCGCDMGYCGVFLSWGFVGCLRSLWLPEAVLNQSQVIIFVSDWEPYLGSHILWVFRGWLFLSLCLHQIGLFRFSLFHFIIFVVSACIVFPSLKYIMNHHHAEFWSDPCSTSSSEEIEERRYIGATTVFFFANALVKSSPVWRSKLWFEDKLTGRA